ncbi:cytochrome c biogenesis CcdA family protein [Roseovarius nitratireducens]|uniref:cytochrome c biogenesis CcdA family protein n=1 Tax=Roseovarius nitratireducens TaxID=2044597 RepID=UPI000CE1C712|nr:cytochrome c biogenesis protein CcdA [Roseovarius nitratireducens]
MSSLVIYGFTAGAVATVNPCGFALLPAWFAREMAVHEGRPAADRLIRAIGSGGMVSLGFVSIFVVAGVLLAAGSEWLGPALPWIGVTLGLALVLIGISWVASVRLPGVPVVERCRRVSTRYGAFGFGLFYGLGSISCTLPVFMSVAGLSFLLESEISLAGFLAYLAGATIVLTLVALGGTLVGSGLLKLVQVSAGFLRRTAGVLILLAGLYIALYWGRLFLDNATWADEIAYSVGAYASRVGMFLSSRTGLTILLSGFAAIALMVWIARVSGANRK